jgi:hypothetical protein
MANLCAHFRHLAEQVDELESKFMSDQVAAESVDPLNFQPDLDKLAAFRLLVHAEIEDFLETKAKQNVASIESKTKAGPWMRNSPELLPMAFVLRKAIPLYDVVDVGTVSTYVGELVQAARKAIGENNGIKSNSFLMLSLCAGKTLDEIDSVLSNSLNSYGKDRGDVAHKSVIRSASLKAPTTELATVKSLIAQIGNYFDVCR